MNEIHFDLKLIFIINIRPASGFKPQLFEHRRRGWNHMTTIEQSGSEQERRHDLSPIQIEDGRNH